MLLGKKGYVVVVVEELKPSAKSDQDIKEAATDAL